MRLCPVERVVYLRGRRGEFHKGAIEMLAGLELRILSNPGCGQGENRNGWKLTEVFIRNLQRKIRSLNTIWETTNVISNSLAF